MNRNDPRPVVIVGSTASGKSDVAMALATTRSADAIGFEIVAVDAMQVYRGMDIGTAKPTVDDQRTVRHHALDLVDPSAEFTVADFGRAAGAALADITTRGQRPLLVGGTGLYLRALTDPMEMPGNWPDIRAALEVRVADGEPVPVLHAQLAALDPMGATKMEPSNARRVVRALEVCLGSGRPFSSFGPGMDQYSPTRFIQVGLRWPRPVLTHRIEQRVHRMIAAGLMDEVRRVAEAHPDLSRTARQALGYKELLAHLDGTISLDQAVRDVVVRTRQFAVRQDRWFRRDPRIQWVDIEADPVTEVVPVVEGLLTR